MMPATLGYNSKIENQGNVVGRGCIRASLKSSFNVAASRPDPVYIMDYLKTDYDLLGQSTKGSAHTFLTPNKKNQTKDCCFLVEFEMGLTAINGDLFSGSNYIFIMTLFQKQTETNLYLTTDELRISTSPWDDSFYLRTEIDSYHRTLLMAEPSDEIYMMIFMRQPYMSMTFDRFNMTITDISQTCD